MALDFELFVHSIVCLLSSRPPPPPTLSGTAASRKREHYVCLCVCTHIRSMNVFVIASIIRFSLCASFRCVHFMWMPSYSSAYFWKTFTLLEEKAFLLVDENVHLPFATSQTNKFLVHLGNISHVDSACNNFIPCYHLS